MMGLAFLKDNILGNKYTVRHYLLDFLVTTPRGIVEKMTLSASRIEFGPPLHSKCPGPTLSPKNMEVCNILSFSRE